MASSVSGVVHAVCSSRAGGSVRLEVAGVADSTFHAVSKDSIPGELGARVLSKSVELLLDRI